ncbi:MAG: preprotein translocase subunit SecY [Candidatus Dependentiae bacterium]|nr:preprotein translocase subunit SecY [Candidatus Dependentiae bacterium]
MVILKNFINIFYIPELFKKVLFTLGVLIIYRLGTHIPVIGVDIAALQEIMQQSKGLGGFFGYLDLFSGGTLRQCTLFALGMGPYITASIMMQFLGFSIPALEQLLKEGEYGRKVINQYTRYLAILVSIVQSSGIIYLLRHNNLILDSSFGFYFMFIFSLTVGSIFLMWLGEQISLFGLGNGSSMIIFAGIVASFPQDVWKTIYSVFYLENMSGIVALALLGFFLISAACIVFLEKGERKIPVQYTRRVVGNRVYGGQSTYIPFKINTPGVMPVIFTGVVLNIPMFIASLLAQRFAIFNVFTESLEGFGAIHTVLEFVLIIAFSYFYTSIIYNPEELADNLKKSGGFIPGIRPGRKTAEFFNYILTRIGLVGAVYLALLAIAPNLLYKLIYMPFFLTGTALLIVVGVAMDTAAQLEAYLIEHRYEGFLTNGRMKMRGTR